MHCAELHKFYTQTCNIQEDFESKVLYYVTLHTKMSAWDIAQLTAALPWPLNFMPYTLLILIGECVSSAGQYNKKLSSTNADSSFIPFSVFYLFIFPLDPSLGYKEQK